MANHSTVERRAGDDGPDFKNDSLCTKTDEGAESALTAGTPCIRSDKEADVPSSGSDEGVDEERAHAQRDIDTAIGHRLRDAEQRAYRRFMEENGHKLQLGEIALNILEQNGEAPQQPENQARPTVRQEEPHSQGGLPDPAALIREAQREIEAIGDPDFTLEAVMTDDRSRFMLAQGRDIYEIYGRFRAQAQQGRRAPARPRVEARSNGGMDSVEYDFRNAPREVIDRIDAQLKRGQYVSL